MINVAKADVAIRAAGVGELLRRFIGENETYQRRWASRSSRASDSGEINIAAVTKVVAQYLWDTGERPESMSPRAVRDRIRRALSGELCSPSTLTWLVGAFEMSQADATDLSRALSGISPRAATGALTRGDLPEIQHRTRSLNEFHQIGPDRLPRRHRTSQVIEALVDGYTTYPYRFDTPEARVLVEEGGIAGPVRPDRPGLWAVDIDLTRPLNTGQTASVVYETRFAYRHPPRPEFRRGARTRVDSVNLRVRFHPAALPSQVWWARWDDSPDPTTQESVTLDAEHSAHRFLTLLDSTIVGFHWEW